MSPIAAKPKLITHKIWAPPLAAERTTRFRCPTAIFLIVVDEAVLDHQEDGDKPIWIFDIREKSNPISISTFPSPADADYKSQPAAISARTIFMKTGRAAS